MEGLKIRHNHTKCVHFNPSLRCDIYFKLFYCQVRTN